MSWRGSGKFGSIFFPSYWYLVLTFVTTHTPSLRTGKTTIAICLSNRGGGMNNGLLINVLCEDVPSLSSYRSLSILMFGLAPHPFPLPPPSLSVSVFLPRAACPLPRSFAAQTTWESKWGSFVMEKVLDEQARPSLLVCNPLPSSLRFAAYDLCNGCEDVRIYRNVRRVPYIGRLSFSTAACPTAKAAPSPRQPRRA